MAHAIGTPDKSRFSSDREDHVSLALSLPMEMIEIILQNLSVPDLLRSTAHLPSWWQQVLMSSPVVWKKLARYRYDENVNILLKNFSHNAASPAQKQKMKINQTKTVVCLLRGSMLFIHHSPLGRGYILAPAKENSSLRIVDSDTIKPWYRKPGRAGYWSLKLYDLDGANVCNERVTNEAKAHLHQLFE